MADHPDDPTPDTEPEPTAGPPDPAGAEAPDAAEPGPGPEPPAGPDTAEADVAGDEAEASSEAAGAAGHAPDTEPEPEPTAGPPEAADTEPVAGVGMPGDDTAEVEGVGDDGAVGDGRRGWVVLVGVGVLVAVVLVVLGVLAQGGGDGEEVGEEDVAGEEDDADGGGTDTTAGTTVPPATTGPGAPAAGLLSEIEPVEGEAWTPAEDGVTIGGTAYAETVVSGPIGTCEDGAAQTVTYDLAGGYTRLDGVVGLVDGTDTGLTVEVGFEVDGEQVWWRTFAEGESTRAQLDLTGARELTVTATGLFPGTGAGEACVRAAYGDLTLR